LVKGWPAIFRLLAAALCLPVCVAAPARAAMPAPPLLGDYLDTGYIQALQQTGSPAQAAAADTKLGWPQLITVEAAAAARRITLTYGWREGRMLVVLQRDGRMHRELAWGKPPPVALRLAGQGMLCLASEAAPQPHCYRHVGDARRYVTRAVLAGEYRDRQGQLYRFSADGRAHFPDFDFHYALVLEHDPCDVFQIDGADRFMAFRRAAGTITLYAVDPGRGAGFGTPDFGHPLAVLREAVAAPRR
jgi:hypothetical protein